MLRAPVTKPPETPRHEPRHKSQDDPRTAPRGTSPEKVPAPPAVPRLVVRLDHVAAIRDLRGGRDPDPAGAAVLAEIGGADGVVVHLREDRRNITERDVRALRAVARRLIVEVALDDVALRFLRDVAPHAVRIVPASREDVTLASGLDCTREPMRLQRTVKEFADAGIDVSCSLDADPRQIRAAAAAGVSAVELNTGRWAAAREGLARDVAHADLVMAAAAGRETGLRVFAGRGLDTRNLASIVALPAVEEVCLGHSVVARALLTGFERAVADAKAAVAAAAAPRLRDAGDADALEDR